MCYVVWCLVLLNYNLNVPYKMTKQEVEAYLVNFVKEKQKFLSQKLTALNLELLEIEELLKTLKI